MQQPVGPLTTVDVIVVVAGVTLFAWWLLNTGLGRRSLASTKPRRHCMAPATPLVLFLLWYFGNPLLAWATVHTMRDAAHWQKDFGTQLVYSMGSLGTVVIVLILAKLDFARGFKGFGVRLRTAPKDLGWGFLTLLGTWPLVLAALSLTILVTRLFYGRQYRIPPHEALKMITEAPVLALQVLVVVVAVVVAPVVEEMLFRGLFQTTIRSYLQRPWPAIALTALLFASIHPDASHWPALFVLALGLGYAYEKSGSLLRPIFMHAMFNGVTIATVLTQGPGWT